MNQTCCMGRDKSANVCINKSEEMKTVFSELLDCPRKLQRQPHLTFFVAYMPQHTERILGSLSFLNEYQYAMHMQECDIWSIVAVSCQVTYAAASPVHLHHRHLESAEALKWTTAQLPFCAKQPFTGSWSTNRSILACPNLPSSPLLHHESAQHATKLKDRDVHRKNKDRTASVTTHCMGKPGSNCVRAQQLLDAQSHFGGCTT